jgi:hypothetical protein
MALVNNQNKDDQNQNGPISLGADSGFSDVGSGGNSLTPKTDTSQSVTPTNTNAGFTDFNQVLGQNQNPNTNWLSTQLTNQGNSLNSAIDNSKNQFMSSAQNGFMPWQKAQGIVDNYYNGNGSLGDAQNAYNAKYTGPNALDASPWATGLNTFGQNIQNTTNQNGINSLESQFMPGLTNGERSFDSNIYSQNPAFGDVRNSLMSLFGQVNQNGEDAKKYATDTANSYNSQEDDVRKNAHNYIGNLQNGLGNTFSSQLNAAQANDSNLANMFANNKSQNEIVDLSPIFQQALSTYESGFSPTQRGTFDQLAQSLNPGQQTLNKGSFWKLNQGDAPTFGNTATPQQVDQWNRLNALAQNQNNLTWSQRNAPTMNFNNDAYTAALNALRNQYAQQLPQKFNNIQLPNSFFGSPGQDGGASYNGGNPTSTVPSTSNGRHLAVDPINWNGPSTDPNYSNTGGSDGGTAKPQSITDPLNWNGGYSTLPNQLDPNDPNNKNLI